MGKKKQVLEVENKVQNNVESSDDEGPTPMKKRMLRPDSSDSEVEEPKSINRKMRKRKVEIDNLVESSKQRKILRCADSSDEENVENSSVSTPKAERINKLQEMRKKIQAKKKVVYDSSNEVSSEEDQEWLVEDEDKLPVWENEEAPPEEKLEKVDDEDKLPVWENEE